MKRSKSFIYSNRESFGSYCNEYNLGHSLKRRANNPEVYQAVNIFKEMPDCVHRETAKFSSGRGRNTSLFNKYSNTSQIMGLPGGEKRPLLEIDDDIKPIIKSDKVASTTKMHKDFKSNIACLPGTGVNSYYQHRKIGLTYKYQPTDIFNVNPCNSNYNRYNYNSFKAQIGKRHVNHSNIESKHNTTQHFGMKCQGYKNISQIQLC